ncbi:hypothetical protein DH09_10145 [Bacillaceae bacterium JMAK1]|nr:hypothetical protein DH09_10145 [Bacillaceae bacterium JMAK1]
MVNLTSYGNPIDSFFELLGYNENAISSSTAFILSKSPKLLNYLLSDLIDVDTLNQDQINITIQKYEHKSGITDIEIIISDVAHIIIEAKRGWSLPAKDQLLKYANRDSFKYSLCKNRLLVTLSECTKTYASYNLPSNKEIGIDIKHMSWGDLYSFAVKTRSLTTSVYEKKLLTEYSQYLKGLITMQNINSNEVYVVSLSTSSPKDASISWIDIVEKKKKYFHPMGKNWLNIPPNYIAFRYHGHLQSIHFIENYHVTTKLHEYIPELAKETTEPYFIYDLGAPIPFSKIVKSGKNIRNARLWCHLDILLTADTVLEAFELTKKRKSSML